MYDVSLPVDSSCLGLQDKSGRKRPQGVSGTASTQRWVSPEVRSDQAAPDFFKTGLGNFQGWSLHSPSKPPAPPLHCPHRGKYFPYIQSTSSLFEVMSCPPTMDNWPNSILLTVCTYWSCASGPLQLLLLHSEQAFPQHRGLALYLLAVLFPLCRTFSN